MSEERNPEHFPTELEARRAPRTEANQNEHGLARNTRVEGPDTALTSQQLYEQRFQQALAQQLQQHRRNMQYRKKDKNKKHFTHKNQNE
jgi:hypothetical protein